MTQAETLPSPRHTAMAYLNGVAGHELKNLVATTVASHPVGDRFNTNDPASKLCALQGDDPCLTLEQMLATTHTYTPVVLGMSRVARRSPPAEARAIKGWQVNPDSQELRLATGGLLASLSLDYPDISTQQLFGHKTLKSYAMPHAQTHYIICRALSDMSARIPTQSGLQPLPRTVVNVVEGLVGAGIATIDDRDPNPTIEIYHNLDFFAKSNPLQSTLHEALRTSEPVEGGCHSTTVEDLVRRVCELRPDTNPERIRKYLLERLDNRTAALRGIKIHGRPQRTIAGLSPYVSLSPGASDMVNDMVAGIEGLVAGEDVSDYAARARAILASPPAVKKLIQKWRQFSPLIQSAQRLQQGSIANDGSATSQ